MQFFGERKLKKLRNKFRTAEYLYVRFSYLLKIRFPGMKLGKLYFHFYEKKKINAVMRINNVVQVSDSCLKIEGGALESNFSKKLNIGIVIHEKIQRNNIWMEHEFAFAYKESLKDLHIKSEIYDTTTLVAKNTSTDEFTESVISKRITHLVLLGDTMLNGQAFLTEDNLEKLRTVHSIKTIVVFMDCLVTSNAREMLEFWKEKSDVIVVHHPILAKYLKSKRLVIWPSLPYPEEFFAELESCVKDTKLLIPGSSHRFRTEWADLAIKNGLEINKQINTRTENRSNTYSIREYFLALAHSKFIFTNGYRNSRESQVIAKTTEVMLVGSLLLYERGSQLDYFFSPYLDYLPVRNVSDLVSKVNYLAKNPDIADRIIFNGRKKLQEQFNTRLFWESILINQEV